MIKSTHFDHDFESNHMDLIVLAQPNIGSGFHVGTTRFRKDCFDLLEQDDLRCLGVRLKRDLQFRNRRNIAQFKNVG
jgi:hypothetical protein